MARWEPEGRRRFTTAGDVDPVTAESGTGSWEAIPVSGLSDTRGYLTERYGDRAAVPPNQTENSMHYATNRPEDVEVGPDGAVYIAFTNNSTVRDSHGAVRRLAEDGNDPTAMTFTWEDFAAGGPPSAGGEGFSSPDNLHFDSRDNLWVVTDISTGSLNSGVYDFHDNNAVFMIPTRGPNAGVAFRFANMPIEAEGTGPYFTPDEKTLFVNVQHPGEQSGVLGSASVFGQPTTYTSYWPDGNKTTGRNPSEPIPSTVAVTRVSKGHDDDSDSDSDSDSDRGRDSDSD